ncbi:aminopeptidase P family protein [Clostridium algidicarnis]|uniref:aminopeptidase P family protein n=1 Tax=Clostridium algidicarnis TaxID=37659 RepID=UPI001CF2B779|nr:aminopeptidase P family protein [Clostridium algidicarnis]MCB2285756.1 aminopeptidase P family protein [Clostridium algidicarnis]
MNIKDRIKLLRAEMKKDKISAYIIPSSDYHQSEYVAKFFKSREWISGFTGSAGTIVITENKAGLWTDGRYFIQANKELKDSGIDLFKMGIPNIPTYDEWILSELNEGDKVGFDGRTISVSQYNKMEKEFRIKEITIEHNCKYIDKIWEDRPEIPSGKMFKHEVKYTGKTALEKINEVRDILKKKTATAYFISSVDDIAWLFNLRGSDVANNPVFLSYALVTLEKAILFVDKNKVKNLDLSDFHKDNIQIVDYNDVETIKDYLDSKDKVSIDLDKTNIYLYKIIESKCSIMSNSNITTALKAVKNTEEIKSMKNSHIKDGTAMVKFIYWLKTNIGKEEITEISATDKLESFRKEQDLFIEPSFDTIAGYKDHAAMMHYKASKESQYVLKKEGLFLVDSGGQYLDGTTDITRTIAMGPLTKEEKDDFTLVLKGHIDLSSATFLYGTTGSNLDILARKPMWDRFIDYKCGTGHGVGFLLNVHEGPHRISTVPSDVRLELGMIVTNEPGIYREGKHGIRTENVLLTVEKGESEFGKFFGFETISYCPIDLDAINPELLTKVQKDWLNNYHEMVYEKISPNLKEEERKWLYSVTRSI